MGVRQLAKFGILAGALSLLMLDYGQSSADPPLVESQPHAVWGSSPKINNTQRRVIATTERPPTLATRVENGVRPPDDGLRSRTVGVSKPGTPQRSGPPLSIVRPVSHTTSASVRMTAPEVEVPKRSQATTDWSHLEASLGVHLDIRAPQRASPGALVEVRLTAKNPTQEAIQGAELELPLPAGIRYVSSQPKAILDEGYLRWTLSTIESGKHTSVLVSVQVQEPQELAFRPAVRLRTNQRLGVDVVEPSFSIRQMGPEEVQLGMPVRLGLEVHNRNEFAIHRVVVRNRLPEGFQHPQGEIIGAELGTLEAGESRKLDLTVLASKPGRMVNVVTAMAEGGLMAHSHCVIVVQKPKLTLELKAPQQQRFGQDMECRIRLAHTGDERPAREVQLSVQIPPGLSFHKASHEGKYDLSTDRVLWQMGYLLQREEREVTVVLRPQQEGEWKLAVTARSQGKVEALAEQAVVLDTPNNYRLVMEAGHNPLEVGRETVYEVRLYNKGSLAGKGLRLTAWLPEGVAPVRTVGPLVGRILQQKIVFESIGVLESEGLAIYRFRVRGQRTGNWRLRVDLHSEGWPSIYQEMRVVIQPANQPRGWEIGEIGSLEK